jgi:RimJ/RimL family protein N-acetyltransferase
VEPSRRTTSLPVSTVAGARSVSVAAVMIEGSQRGLAEPSGRGRERVADIPLSGVGLARLAPGEPIRDSARVDAMLVVRPIEPGDKEGLAAAFERLSPESRYRRFLTPHDRLSAELRYLTEVDHRDHEALVAIDPRTGEGVGVARYVRDRDDHRNTEIAFAVADDWQRQGVGTELLHRLADRARDGGVSRFTALMLADNTAMRHVLGDLGAVRVVDRAQGGVELSVDVPKRGLGSTLPAWLRSAARGALRLASAQ